MKKLGLKIEKKQAEFEILAKRIRNYDEGVKDLSDLENALENATEYQLPEPQGFISVKAYKKKIVEPFVKKLKLLIKAALVHSLEGWDNYQMLNITNRNLYRENERLIKTNNKLTVVNNQLKEQNKDYKLLRKVFGNKQIDSLLEQARQSKQRNKCFRNIQNQR